MSIVQLRSDNKDLSFIISKNPATGMISKSLRKGVIFGYYSENDPNSFNIYFKDGSDEVSFPSYEGEDYEYLNVSRFNSASFVVSAIDEMLRSAFKSNEYKTPSGDQVDNGGAKSVFVINMIYVNNERYIKAFEDYFPDYKVEAKVVTGKNYQVTITTEKSIYELLNFASLFGIFNAIVNNEPMFIADDNIAKYIGCMNIIDAPYFLRYLFKIRFIRSMKTFDKFQEELSKNSTKKIDMKFGDTWQARQMSIEDRLDFQRPIIDVGCGEGKYISRFNKYMKNFKYFAIDVDPDELDKAKRRVKTRSLKNVEFFESTSQLWAQADNIPEVKEKVDIICSEVIEHMPVEDAKVLMSDILSFNINTLIVTTPDVRFNDNYFMTGMRHDDHDWEPTKQEFEDFMKDCFKSVSKEYTMEWFGIGDVVEGVTPSQGIIVKFI